MSENDGHPERSFRCRSCRNAKLAEARELLRQHDEESKNVAKKGKSNRDLSDSSATSGRAPSRDRKVQPKPDERTAHDDDVRESGDSREATSSEGVEN